jgi:hypothetical protein
MPSVSQIPNFISSIRHPERSRSISIGPQSAADAYETLAFRQNHRRESSSSLPRSTGLDKQRPFADDTSGYFEDARSLGQMMESSTRGQLLTPASSSLDLDLQCVPPFFDPRPSTPITPGELTPSSPGIVRTLSQDRRQNEKEAREIFSKIEKPRVRYDVEVVTKLIVYTGSCSLSSHSFLGS